MLLQGKPVGHPGYVIPDKPCEFRLGLDFRNVLCAIAWAKETGRT